MTAILAHIMFVQSYKCRSFRFITHHKISVYLVGSYSYYFTIIDRYKTTTYTPHQTGLLELINAYIMMLRLQQCKQYPL